MKKTPKEWLDKIEEESKKGNVCFLTFEGLMSVPLNEFVKQPSDGILYDLNRLPEVVASWIQEDIKWVNDYAVSKTIQYLKSSNEALSIEVDLLKRKLNIAEKYLSDAKEGYIPNEELSNHCATALINIKETI